MRLVATRRVKLGSPLARDVFDGGSDGLPLLRAGTAITAGYRDALLRAGIHAIYAEDELSAGIEVPQPLTDETRRRATIAVARALQDTRAGVLTGGGLSTGAVADLSRIAALMCADIAACGDAVVALNDLASADGYTLQHSIDVAALGLLLGQRLFRERGWVDHRGRRVFDRLEHRLARLGLGLLLHDIGKLAVPAEILQKPDSLTDHEMALVREHPLAGLQFVQDSAVSPLAKAIIRSHHERWDGRGYPDGRAGDKIHEFARVASVADVFDALTSERPYHSSLPISAAIDAIVAGSGTAFDPEVVDVFRRTVAPYPPGTEVALSDGRQGIVSLVPPSRIDRPVVRIVLDPYGRPVRPTEVELAREPELTCVSRGLVEVGLEPVPMA